MDSFKKIADIIVASPDDEEKVRKILENADISVVDEGMRLTIIEKIEE